jgi:hypothetical protein
VSFSPPVYRPQGRPRDVLPQQADQHRHAWRAAIQDAVVRQRPRQEGAVRRALNQRVRHDRLHACCSPPRPGNPGAVYNRPGEWERRNNRQIKHDDVGTTVLFTDRQALSEPRMVVASRHQAPGADRFRLRKRRRPGRWWPAPHWPARNLLVHARSGFVALLVSRRVLLRLHDRPLSLGGGLLTARRRGSAAALVVSANGAAPRVITVRRPEQEARLVALDVRTLAAQGGKTVRNP